MNNAAAQVTAVRAQPPQGPAAAGIECHRSSCAPGYLRRYADLFAICFPHSQKLSISYLAWLYRDNPAGPVVGYDAFVDGRLVAHYAAVPVLLSDGTKLRRACWSLNTATHPDFQGRGLFTVLASRTYEAASQEGYVAVLGVANQNSTHGFIKKLGFRLYGPLTVLAGYRMRAEPRPGALRRAWSPELLAWRLRNPSQQYYTDRSRRAVYAVAGKSRTPVLLARLDGAKAEAAGRLESLPWMSRVQPTVTVTYGAQCAGLSLPVPRRLLPSPWNLIYRSLAADQPEQPPLAVLGIDLDSF